VLSIGAKINHLGILDDLEWSLCSLLQNTCAMVLLLIYIASHSVCFQAVNDCSGCSTSCVLAGVWSFGV